MLTVLYIRDVISFATIDLYPHLINIYAMRCAKWRGTCLEKCTPLYSLLYKGA